VRATEVLPGLRMKYCVRRAACMGSRLHVPLRIMLMGKGHPLQAPVTDRFDGDKNVWRNRPE